MNTHSRRFLINFDKKFQQLFHHTWNPTSRTLSRFELGANQEPKSNEIEKFNVSQFGENQLETSQLEKLTVHHRNHGTAKLISALKKASQRR